MEYGEGELTMIERDKSFFENAKKIIKRYPEAIWEICKYKMSFWRKVYEIIFTVVLYFPIMFLVVLFELLSGAPFEGGGGPGLEEILEDFERDGTLDDEGKIELANIRKRNEVCKLSRLAYCQLEKADNPLSLEELANCLHDNYGTTINPELYVNLTDALYNKLSSEGKIKVTLKDQVPPGQDHLFEVVKKEDKDGT